MTTYRLSSDNPERLRRVTLRRLAAVSSDFTEIAVNDDGTIDVTASRPPEMPGFVNVAVVE